MQGIKHHDPLEKLLSLHFHHHFSLAVLGSAYFKAALLGSSTFGTREDEDLRMVWLNDRRHQGGATWNIIHEVGNVELLAFWLEYIGIYRCVCVCVKGYNLDRFQLWFRWIDVCLFFLGWFRVTSLVCFAFESVFSNKSRLDRVAIATMQGDKGVSCPSFIQQTLR